MSELHTSVTVPVWMRDARQLWPLKHDWAHMTISNDVKTGNQHDSFLVKVDILMPGSDGPVSVWVTRHDLIDALERCK